MKNLDKLLEWETHPSRVLYAFKDTEGRTPLYVPPACDDDIPTGHTWRIENNHYGHMVFMTGVRLGDDTMKAHGLASLDHGISRQDENGSFPCGDVHHSAAFFFEVLARFIMLAELTGVTDTDRFRQSLHRGLLWFHDRRSWDDDHWRDSMHHRFLLNGTALYLGWDVLRDMPIPGGWADQAPAWIAEGIRRQRDDGTITELGGHDTGYQSLCITFGCGLLLTCDVIHADLRGALTRCMERATAWLLGRINNAGYIDGSGNARMDPSKGEVSRETGLPKDVKFYETAFALYGAGLALDDTRCFDAVERIMNAYLPA